MYELASVLSCRSTAHRYGPPDNGNAFGAWRGNRPFLIGGCRSGAYEARNASRINDYGCVKARVRAHECHRSRRSACSCYYISNVVRRLECLRALRSEFRQLVCSTTFHRPRPTHVKTPFAEGGKKKMMSTFVAPSASVPLWTLVLTSVGSMVHGPGKGSSKAVFGVVLSRIICQRSIRLPSHFFSPSPHRLLMWGDRPRLKLPPVLLTEFDGDI